MMCCMFSVIRKKEHIDERISPVQFLRDRELDNEKHGIVIKEPVSDWSLLTRQKVYGYETNVTMSMKRDIGIEMLM